MFLSLDINSAWVSHGSFLYVLPEHGDLLNMDFSQSSVATYLERSGLFKYDFITNFLNTKSKSERILKIG